MKLPPRTLIIACGATARELVTVIRANRWTHIEVQCLPANWHNTPSKIAPGVEEKILDNRQNFEQILVAYGDCGTGGLLDKVLLRHQIERLPGPHCYAYFTGEDQFEQFHNAELGTFYLTDYLATNFDRLILDGFGITAHPELRDMYFANYTRVLYLAQTHNEKCLEKAQTAADSIALPLVVHYTGLRPFQQVLERLQFVKA